MKRIPDIVIERVLLGEATAEQRAAVMANADAKARLEALESDNAVFLKAHPTESMLPEIERKLHLAKTKDAVKTRRDRLTWAGLILAPLAAVTVAMVSIEPPPAEVASSPISIEGEGIVRPKGDPIISLYRKVNGRTRGINRGTVLRQRDLVQLGYRAGWANHGVLFSIDGRGAVTLHSPDDGDTELREGRVLLPHAYELDDAPEFERFFLVAAKDAFEIQPVLDAAEDLAASEHARQADLDVPAGLYVKDFTILKDVL